MCTTTWIYPLQDNKISLNLNLYTKDTPEAIGGSWPGALGTNLPPPTRSNMHAQRKTSPTTHGVKKPPHSITYFKILYSFFFYLFPTTLKTSEEPVENL